ncbi:hypothetical protein [Methylosinus sp. RM1]|nr:hypothetical protein [Methylosinus sp. RM1]
MKIAAYLCKRFVEWHRRVDWKRLASALGAVKLAYDLFREIRGN